MCLTLCVQIVTNRGGYERNHCSGAVFRQFILCSKLHESYQFRHKSGPVFALFRRIGQAKEPFIYKAFDGYVDIFTNEKQPKTHFQFDVLTDPGAYDMIMLN